MRQGGLAQAMANAVGEMAGPAQGPDEPRSDDPACPWDSAEALPGCSKVSRILAANTLGWSQVDRVQVEWLNRTQA